MRKADSMGYTAIATLLHAPKRQTAAFDMAIALARMTGAHLHVLCAGVDETDPGFYYAGAQAVAIRANLAQAKQDAYALEEIARTRLRSENISWDVKTLTVMPGGMEPYVSDAMRYYDLIVLPAPYQAASDHWDVSGFEASLFGADRPVLVVPEGAQPELEIKTTLIGWDDSLPALAAIRAAKPFISRAKRTRIAMIEPSAVAPDRSDPGGRLARYLIGYGAHIDISVSARSQSSIGAQLHATAQTCQAELIVMGAYNKSRLREAILGGATRDILRLTTLPVLMAH